MSGTGESWEPREPVGPDAVADAFEYRWALRQGILSPPAMPTGEVRNQPDAAGYEALAARGEPRRGSLRLSPSGGPQQPQVPAQRAADPGEIGPPLPDRGGAAGALDMVMNTLLAAQQGVTEAGLEDAQPITLPEVQRLLHNPDDGDAPDLMGRLRAAKAVAEAAGIDAVFRVGPLGRIEAVARAPDMEAPGGAFGRVADSLGRLMGLGLTDPLRGVRGGVQ